MEPDSRNTLIGAAVVALALAMVAALVWLSAGTRADAMWFAIHFERQSLMGLQVGSDVNMRGVKVGRVEAYRISPVNHREVDVRIRVASDTPVHENTSAVVSRSLVTGLAWIDLITAPEPGPKLVTVLPGERYPVIREGTSDLDQITDALGRFAVTGESALANFDRLLGADNQKAVMDVVATARQTLLSMEQAVLSLRDTSVAFQDTARTLTAAGRDVSGTLTRTMTRVDPMLEDARTAMVTMTRTAKMVESEMGKLAKGLSSGVDTGALELRVTARELRGSAEALSRTAERLREPGAAIFGPSSRQLGPGEGQR